MISEWKLWVIYVTLFKIVASEFLMYPGYIHVKYSNQLLLCVGGSQVACLDTWYIFCYTAEQNNFGHIFQMELIQYF